MSSGFGARWGGGDRSRVAMNEVAMKGILDVRRRVFRAKHGLKIRFIFSEQPRNGCWEIR